MFFKRVTIFHFFGFPIRADLSWLFLSALIFWTLATNTYPRQIPGLGIETYQLMAVATLFGLIASIIAHEVAHAIIAEYYNMPIESITLFIFGGVAEMRGEPSHPKGEFLMALAGPMMSALFGLFFMAINQLYEMYIGTQDPVSWVLTYLGMINFLIAGFNMIPAFPLDGGRALRAAIWQYKKNLVLATRIASDLGAMFAYAMLVYACWQIIKHDDVISGMWTGILGLFLHAAGSYAVRQTESRSLLGRETVARFLHNQLVTVSPDLTINTLVDQYVYKHYQKVFPVVENGKLRGIITLQTLLSLDRHKWQWLHVASVMERPEPDNTVPQDFNAADALDKMQRTGREMLLVADGEHFMGAVSYRDLVAFLSITMKIDHNKPVIASRRVD
ncbi:MAG TPA: site-2 protease family protein [Alphaproteobacteria bacterium]|nr:site-2 protease family protein [Alphaproteobacteria bacterium]